MLDLELPIIIRAKYVHRVNRVFNNKSVDVSNVCLTILRSRYKNDKFSIGEKVLRERFSAFNKRSMKNLARQASVSVVFVEV